MTLKSDRFYLPYQFVPVTGRCNSRLVDRARRSDVRDGTCDVGAPGAGARHDVWLQGHRSGRIVCRVTTETPTFVGARRQPGTRPVRVDPAVDRDNRRTIPGNSIRGAVGSLIEALSQSSMRVLADDRLERSGFPQRGKFPIPGSIHGAFGHADMLLLPYCNARKQLSPAELLLGVVSEDSNSASTTNKNVLLALASRVRFSDARLVTEGQVHGPEVTLQILSSPKPQSPAFYFSDGDAKRKTLDLTKHRPNGRKFYLHHQPEQLRIGAYVSHHQDAGLDEQKVRVSPIVPGVQFEFHLDFDNLSDAELHLLLVGLRPAADFRHRLGMGKPLGLGTVRVDVLGVFEVDRSTRYSAEALDAPRYSKIASDPSLKITDVARYKQEIDECKAASHASAFSQGDHSSWTPGVPLVDSETLGQLLVLGGWKDGSPLHLERDIPVCYQRTAAQLVPYASADRRNAKLSESELFKWVVDNEKKAQGYQRLQRVLPGTRLKPFNAT